MHWNKTVLQNQWKSKSQDFCSLMQEDEKYISAYKEECGNDFDKLTRGYEGYRLSKKRRK